jgi:hypothetical protein
VNWTAVEVVFGITVLFLLLLLALRVAEMDGDEREARREGGER